MGVFTGENFPQQTNPLSKHYPLVNIQKAIENGPVDIVDLPINSMVIFHSFFVCLPEGKTPIELGDFPAMWIYPRSTIRKGCHCCRCHRGADWKGGHRLGEMTMEKPG